MWLLILFILAVIFGGLGFGGFVVAGVMLFKVLFFVFLLAFIAALISSFINPPA
jgi:uncharacterized membrane protein YtjA (UPF0391 family)